MIVFDNWVIRAEEKILLRQFDDRAATLKVTGNLPEGWEWVMLVRKGKNMDLLPLERMGGGIGIVLTAGHLALSGHYDLQLRGKSGSVVRHSNVLTVRVDASVSGDVQWPDIPTSFSELEERVAKKAQQAEGYAAHPPVVGENGTWWTWDGTAYADTGKPSKGEAGVVPQRGVDYWTQADREEIKSYVDEAILGGAW